MSCLQVPATPAFNPYPRLVQVGEFEVATDGGIWVAIRGPGRAHLKPLTFDAAESSFKPRFPQWNSVFLLGLSVRFARNRPHRFFLMVPCYSRLQMGILGANRPKICRWNPAICLIQAKWWLLWPVFKGRRSMWPILHESHREP